LSATCSPCRRRWKPTGTTTAHTRAARASTACTAISAPPPPTGSTGSRRSTSPALPRDPRLSTDPLFQYLYRSDGTDYKLISHGTCEPFNVSHRWMIDPKRNCFAIGIWTPGAKAW
jgi:hypothetical protein